jgi:hypothetical protein
VRHKVGAPHTERLESEVSDAVEQPLARAEEHRRDMQASSSMSPAARYWFTV